MSATATANAADGRASADKLSTDIEKPAPAPAHEENSAKREVDYIPQSDEEYNVTFKTWIVVWVGRPLIKAYNLDLLTDI